MRQYGSSALREQRHLTKDSTERTYWNYGYLMALREALDLVTDQNDTPKDYSRKRDTSSARNLYLDH